MKLKTFKRNAERKGELTRLRLDGKVPAVVYHQGKQAHPIAISLAEYEAMVRDVIPGRLSTTKVSLVDEEGTVRTSILKEIQYHPTSYKVLHLDFEQLDENVPVNVKVPLECLGIADCVGIKLGGVLRQVIRKVKVRCLPKHIPHVFQIDIRNMEMQDSKRIKDLEISKEVKPLVNPSEVAIVIAKR